MPVLQRLRVQVRGGQGVLQAVQLLVVLLRHLLLLLPQQDRLARCHARCTEGPFFLSYALLQHLHRSLAALLRGGACCRLSSSALLLFLHLGV